MRLGYKIIVYCGLVVVSTFVLGWLVLIIASIMQRLMPDRRESIERFLQATLKVAQPVQKYSLYAVILVMAIYLAADLLGFLPPAPPPDDPYEFRYGPGSG